MTPIAERSPAVRPAFVSAPWPRYQTDFDLITNVLAYVPLGLLGVFALHPKLRAHWAALVSTLLCAALSFSMEALQTYLPFRVSSNVDWMLNTTGSLAGALVAAPLMLLVSLRLRLLVYPATWDSQQRAGVVAGVVDIIIKGHTVERVWIEEASAHEPPIGSA